MPKQHGRAIFAAFLFLASGAPFPARSATVSILPSADNTLYEDAEGDASNGAGDHLFAGSTAMGKLRRIVLRFDVSSEIPAGATVTSASLVLNVSRVNGPSVPVVVYRLAASWGEAGSSANGQEGMGAPAEIGDATWLHRFYDTTTWAAAGGDFEATPRAAVNVESTGFYTWGPTAELLADVQSWIADPPTNFGWIFLGEETGFGTAKRMDSKENPVIAQRPRLVIEYEPAVAAPSGGVTTESWGGAKSLYR